MLKDKILKNKWSIIVFILFNLILFLEFCPPLSGKFNFNNWLLAFSILCFLVGYFKKDYVICGLIIPTGNALIRLSPVIYPVCSFLCMSVFLGYFFSKESHILYENNSDFENKKLFLTLGFCFWLIMFVSGLTHVIKLLYPSIVYYVNVRTMTNYEIVYHIIGYVIFPLSTAFVLFYLILFHSNNHKIELIFEYLSIGVIISSIVGALQFFGIIKGPFGFVYYQERVTGLFLDFNSFALSLCLLLPIFVYEFFKNKKISFRIIYFISFVFGFVNLFLTGNRAAFMSIILCLIFISVWFIYKNKYRFALICTLFFLIAITFLPKIKTNIYAVDRILSSLNTNINQQMQNRKVYWEVGLSMFLKKPFIGNGLKSGYKEFYNFYPKGYQPDFILNAYLQYLAEIGILGTIVFLILIFIPIYIFIKNINTTSEFIFIFNFVAFLFALIFHVLELEEITLLFWLYLGVIYFKDVYSFSFSNEYKNNLNRVLYAIVSIYMFLSIVDLSLELPKIDVLRYRWYAGLYYDKKIKDEFIFWTDKYAIFRLNELKGKKLNFKFNSAGIKGQEVKVFINNKEYTTLKLDKNYEIWHTFDLEVTDDMENLKIVPKKTFIPAGWFNRYFYPFNGKDYRRLGILLSYRLT